MKKLRIIFLLFILIGLAVFSVMQYPEKVSNYYKNVSFEIKRHWLSYFPYKDRYFKHVTSPEKWMMISWLEKKDYKSLDNYFNALREQYKKDIKYEAKLHSSYKVFGYIDTVNLARLDEWVNLNPVNINALIARAYYFERLAWSKRGNKFMSETSAEQIKSMVTYMEKAIKDASAAIKISADITTPYGILMNAYGAQGKDGLEYYAYKQGIDIIPGTFILRSLYLNSLEPKWGGSIAKMRKYTYSEIINLKVNPGLIRLKSKFEIFIATNKKPICGKRAMAIYENILKYDRYWRVLAIRSRCFNEQGKHYLAADDATEAIMKLPGDYGAYMQRIFAYNKLKKYELVEKDLLFIIDQYPSFDKASIKYVDLLKLTNREDEAIKFLGDKIAKAKKNKAYWVAKRGAIYFKKRQYKKAVSDYEYSISLREKKPWVWSQIGIIYQYHLKDIKKAVAAYKKALMYDNIPLYIYNLAAALYEAKDKIAPDVYREYLRRCEKEKCDSPRIQWATNFITCLNKKKACSLDKHDYEYWIKR